MAFDYVAARQAAKDIITEFGAAGSVVKKGVSGGGFDNNGDPLTDSPDVTITGIITPLLRFKRAEVDGSAIQVNDSFVYFHSDTAPEIDMQVTINSVTLRIIDIKTLSSVDDINIFRKLQLRV